jgi:hypothetical protein
MSARGASGPAPFVRLSIVMSLIPAAVIEAVFLSFLLAPVAA